MLLSRGVPLGLLILGFKVGDLVGCCSTCNVYMYVCVCAVCLCCVYMCGV